MTNPGYGWVGVPPPRLPPPRTLRLPTARVSALSPARLPGLSAAGLSRLPTAGLSAARLRVTSPDTARNQAGRHPASAAAPDRHPQRRVLLHPRQPEGDARADDGRGGG